MQISFEELFWNKTQNNLNCRNSNDKPIDMRFSVTLKKPLVMIWMVLIGLSTGVLKAQDQAFEKEDPGLADKVLIQRTDYGVPHISAETIAAAGYGLGYVQMEDYHDRVINDLLKARGEWAKYHDLQEDRLQQEIDADIARQIQHEKAVQTWPELSKDAQSIIEGFTQAVNDYIEAHPEELEDWVTPFFTVYDVHSAGMESVSLASVNTFLRKIRSAKADDQEAGLGKVDETSTMDFWERQGWDYKAPPVDVGSNAWALAPGRTKSGKAILVRNPHLSWDAGYYEAHVEVPGKFNFYGDYRIGAPLITVGGFNQHLGFSTTNNDSFMDEIYAFEVDPDHPDHFMLDGTSHPLTRKIRTVTVKNGEGVAEVKKEVLTTKYGPVVYRGKGKVFILKSAAADAYRAADQYLAMMEATSLSEWKEAMRIRGIVTSNFTYADADGNIFYVWNGSVPDLPVSWSGEGNAKSVTKSDEIWSQLIPWDQLPQLENPDGGYLHNENDTFHFTNLNAILKAGDFPDYYPEPTFRLRSQKSYELIGNPHEKFSLEDIVRLKNNTGMLLADRVKEDLIKAVKETELDFEDQEEMDTAVNLLENWDNTVSVDSKGGVLFKIWWDRYVETAPSKRVRSTPESVGFPAKAKELFATPWSADRPAETPYGLADKKRAAEALEWAVKETKDEYGSYDVAWGEVHRMLAKDKNEPANGCSGEYGCFRVFWFTPKEVDGKKRLAVTGGDGWVIAVEFGKIPKAYSVLAYGESEDSDSPHYYDQLEMFRKKEMKPVYYTDREIKKHTVKEYRPGKD